MKENGENVGYICGHNKNEAWNKKAHTKKENASQYYFFLSLFLFDKFVMNRKNFS